MAREDGVALTIAAPSPRARALRELAALFLKLGTVAFGGPAAHIAMMEDEVVDRRRWLTRDEFLDYLGATNLIPGPNSTELAIHVGHARAGTPGLIVAGTCFILPAAFIVTAIAWAYVRYGSLPAASALLYGVKPVVIAVVLQALWRLGHTAIKTRTLAIVAVAAIAAVLAGVNELVVLAAAGAIMAARSMMATMKDGERRSVLGATLTIIKSNAALARVGVAGVGATLTPVSLAPLFLIFLKTGAVLFGSGYVLLAFLRADLVERLGWLTERQLLDAIAVGQITPGPVFTTATFVGYVLAGPRGASVATLGIFLPAFVFVALSHRLIPLLRQSATAGAVLDGVNVASLALMAVVTWQLGRSTLVDLPTLVIACVATLTLMRFRVNSAWLVLGGGLIGMALFALRH